MLKNERHYFILEKLRLNNKVLSNALSQELKVSEDTIRRDLRELAENGQIRKVHGGAIPRSPVPFNFAERVHLSQHDKQHIVTEALNFVKSGQVLLLDGGTTNQLVARQLPAHLQLTVFTNSLPVALELLHHPSAEVVMLGGKLMKDSQATTGLEVIEAVHKIRADILMLGICSLHTQIGITLPYREEAQVKTAMIRSAHQVLALATSDKLETAESYIVEAIDKVDVLVTDEKINPRHKHLYEQFGIQVIS
jgi:DeoR/GlpR family transcriptional regulator of sugar metabolism